MLVIGSIFVDVKGFARNRYMPLERNVGDVQVTAGGVCRNVAENLKTLGCDAEFVSMVDDNGMGAQVRSEDGSFTAVSREFYNNAVSDCIRSGCNAITYDLRIPESEELLMIAIWRNGHIDTGSVQSICDCLDR